MLAIEVLKYAGSVGVNLAVIVTGALTDGRYAQVAVNVGDETLTTRQPGIDLLLARKSIFPALEDVAVIFLVDR